MSRVLADPAIQLALHAGLTLLFVRAAWHKLRDPAAFGAALSGYRLLPAAALPFAAAAIASAELATAVGLALPGAGAAPAFVGAALLAGYAAAMTVAWMRGQREIDCGCGPPGSPRRIGADLVVRNGVLAALCAAAALAPAERDLVWLDHLSIAAALVAACALYAFTEHPRARRAVA